MSMLPEGNASLKYFKNGILINHLNMHVCFKDIMHFLETMDMGTHTFHLVSELNVEMFKWKLKCQEPRIFYGYIKKKRDY